MGRWLGYGVAWNPAVSFAVNLLAKEKSLAEQTWSLLGGWDAMEQRPAKLAEKAVRQQACEYIKQIEALEERCLGVLKELGE